MKKVFILFFMLIAISIFPQTVNSRLIPTVDEQNLTYSVLVQINLDSPDVLILKRSHLCYTIDENALEFIDGEILTFIAPEYENYEIHDRHEGHYHSETKLIDGATPVALGQNWIDYAIFNFTILDINAYSDFCPLHIDFRGLDNSKWNEGTWFCDETPLPVELTLFTINNVDNVITLNWTTATELNNYGFYVERNGDSIGFVEGHGNSNSPKYYTFNDNPALSGIYFYRLKQVDNDGTYEYSNVVETEININSYELFQNYPNPFNPSTTIKFELKGTGYVTIKIYDMLGNEIASLVDENKEAGIHYLIFDATSLTSGVYIYRMNVNNNVLIRKMTVIK